MLSEIWKYKDPDQTCVNASLIPLVTYFSEQTTFHLTAKDVGKLLPRASIQLKQKQICKEQTFSAQVRFKLGMHACMCIFNIIESYRKKSESSEMWYYLST